MNKETQKGVWHRENKQPSGRINPMISVITLNAKGLNINQNAGSPNEFKNTIQLFSVYKAHASDLRTQMCWK